MLGDKFSEVALKRTTAGVNFFNISQPTECEDSEQNGEDGWSKVGHEGRKIQQAEDVHQEISKDNQDLRSSWIVEEKSFDIRVRHPLCKMRKDTQLVLVDIPGINEAESSKKYKEYVEVNWKTFDCVVLVMDAVQGVNTQEQVDLLEFVKRNNKEVKDIPTIVLGNKLDDLDDDDTINQIKETRAKTIEIFGNVDCRFVPTNASDTEEVKEDKETFNTSFIPLSAKNAYMYMKALSIDRDDLVKHEDLVNKIGIDEFGRKFIKKKLDDKIKAVLDILEDPSELKERLADTNFNSFLASLSDFIGGEAKQKDILAKKVSMELKSISIDSIGEDQSVSEFILEAYSKSKVIGLTDFDWIKETFWDVYNDRETKIFDKNDENPCSQRYEGPVIMERPFKELKKYQKLTLILEWASETLKAEAAMKQLLSKQLSFLLEKLDEWCFEAYCRSAGGTELNDWSPKAKSREIVFTTDELKWPHYFTYDFNRWGEKQSIGMQWTDGWKGWRAPDDFRWNNLSPQDWIVILESLSLVWNDKYFVENFGADKAKLGAALSKLYATFHSISGIHLQCGDGIDKMKSLCLFAYKIEVQRRGKDGDHSMAQITMPSSLHDPNHWGYLASKYVKFCYDQEMEEIWKEKFFANQLEA